MHFLDNVRAITPDGNKTNDYIFLFTLYALFLRFISEFENTENSFPCGSPFGPF